uniref:Ovule protein n=1 Tax=Elaeophora elaphi TaxID=1147741 RepID=A0A0R3RI31_9BILA
MIDMLARVQRMYETTESIGSGSGTSKNYESITQLRNGSDEDVDRRLSNCCFRLVSSNRSSPPLQSYELVCRTVQI